MAPSRRTAAGEAPPTEPVRQREYLPRSAKRRPDPAPLETEEKPARKTRKTRSTPSTRKTKGADEDLEMADAQPASVVTKRKTVGTARSREITAAAKRNKIARSKATRQATVDQDTAMDEAGQDPDSQEDGVEGQPGDQDLTESVADHLPMEDGPLPVPKPSTAHVDAATQTEQLGYANAASQTEQRSEANASTQTQEHTHADSATQTEETGALIEDFTAQLDNPAGEASVQATEEQESQAQAGADNQDNILASNLVQTNDEHFEPQESLGTRSKSPTEDVKTPNNALSATATGRGVRRGRVAKKEPRRSIIEALANPRAQDMLERAAEDAQWSSDSTSSGSESQESSNDDDSDDQGDLRPFKPSPPPPHIPRSVQFSDMVDVRTYERGSRHSDPVDETRVLIDGTPKGTGSPRDRNSTRKAKTHDEVANPSAGPVRVGVEVTQIYSDGTKNTVRYIKPHIRTRDLSKYTAPGIALSPSSAIDEVIVLLGPDKVKDYLPMEYTKSSGVVSRQLAANPDHRYVELPCVTPVAFDDYLYWKRTPYGIIDTEFESWPPDRLFEMYYLGVALDDVAFRDMVLHTLCKVVAEDWDWELIGPVCKKIFASTNAKEHKGRAFFVDIIARMEGINDILATLNEAEYGPAFVQALYQSPYFKSGDTNQFRWPVLLGKQDIDSAADYEGNDAGICLSYHDHWSHDMPCAYRVNVEREARKYEQPSQDDDTFVYLERADDDETPKDNTADSDSEDDSEGSVDYSSDSEESDEE